jgi:isoquinoline 1-oxidoreductase subunit alpha
MKLVVNNSPREVQAEWREETLLNWLREAEGLVGAKFGCGAGLCGACTVWLNDKPVRACITPISQAQDQRITTIEGLADAKQLHVVQRAWLEAAVPQCGYCQSGHLLAAAALLREVPKPTEDQIDAALAGHLCRCGTQGRMRDAIKSAASLRAGA